jgi:hypothetical protein
MVADCRMHQKNPSQYERISRWLESQINECGMQPTKHIRSYIRTHLRIRYLNVFLRSTNMRTTATFFLLFFVYSVSGMLLGYAECSDECATTVVENDCSSPECTCSTKTMQSVAFCMGKSCSDSVTRVYEKYQSICEDFGYTVGLKEPEFEQWVGWGKLHRELRTPSHQRFNGSF